MCRFSPLGRGAIGGVGSNPRTQGQPTPLPLPGGEMLSGLASVIYLILIPKGLFEETVGNIGVSVAWGDAHCQAVSSFARYVAEPNSHHLDSMKVSGMGRALSLPQSMRPSPHQRRTAMKAAFCHG